MTKPDVPRSQKIEAPRPVQEKHAETIKALKDKVRSSVKDIDAGLLDMQKYSLRNKRIQEIYARLKAIRKELQTIAKKPERALKNLQPRILDKLDKVKVLFSEAHALEIKNQHVSDALTFLAQGKSPDILKEPLVAYLKSIPKNKLKGFFMRVDFKGGSQLVRVTVYRSSDGSYFRVHLKAHEEAGAKNKPDIPLVGFDEYILFLNEKGEKIVPTGPKYSAKLVKKYEEQLKTLPKLGETAAKEAKVEKKESKEKLTSQEKIARALLHLSRTMPENNRAPVSYQEDLKNFLESIKPGKFEKFEATLYGNRVTFTVSRSTEKDKTYYKLVTKAENFEGYSPKAINTGISESQTFLTKEGVKTSWPGNKIKFSDVQDSYPATPEKKGEAKETAKEKEKMELALILGKILEGGNPVFQNNKEKFKTILKKVLPSEPTEKETVINLPGGYSIVSKKREHKAQADIIIMRGLRTVCYRLNRGMWSKKWYYPNFDKRSYVERYVQIMTAEQALKQSLRSVRYHKGRGRLMFTPSGLQKFKDSLQHYEKYTANKLSKGGWSAFFEDVDAEVNYNQKTGEFMFRLPGGALYYNVRKSPHKIGIQTEIGGKKTIEYRSEGNFVLTQADFDKIRKEELKAKAAKKQKPEKAEKPETTENPYKNIDKAEIEKRVRREVKEEMEKEEKTKKGNEKKGTMRALFNPKYKDYVKTAQGKDSYDLTVNFGDKLDNRGRKLINITQIHNLFRMKEMRERGKVMLVTRKRPNGKVEYGMCYLKQGTVYLLQGKDGKQIKKQLRFGNGDIITVQFSDKLEKYYKKLPEREKKRCMSPETGASVRAIREHKYRVALFVKRGGKLGDIDLKPLKQFETKYKSYKSKDILRRTKPIKNVPLKIQVQIIEAEIAAIKKATYEVRVKARLAKEFKKQPKATAKTEKPEKPEAAKSAPNKELLQQVRILRNGDGLSFVDKNGKKITIFKDQNSQLHYVDVSNKTSRKINIGEIRNLPVSAGLKFEKVPGNQLYVKLTEYAATWFKDNNKKLSFSLKDGTEVIIRCTKIYILKQTADFVYSESGQNKGTLNEKDFALIALRMKPNTSFKIE